MIMVSLEHLYHFNCSECKKWWSVGDWTPVDSLTCPHCGLKQMIMTPLEIQGLDVLAKLPKEVDIQAKGVDTLIESLLDHLDKIMVETTGYRGDTVFLNPGPKFNPEKLVWFLNRFVESDCDLCFWYSWMPLRQFLKPCGAWGSFVEKLNEKARTTHPEDPRLLVDPET